MYNNDFVSRQNVWSMVWAVCYVKSKTFPMNDGWYCDVFICRIPLIHAIAFTKIVVGRLQALFFFRSPLLFFYSAFRLYCLVVRILNSINCVLSSLILFDFRLLYWTWMEQYIPLGWCENEVERERETLSLNKANTLNNAQIVHAKIPKRMNHVREWNPRKKCSIDLLKCNTNKKFRIKNRQTIGLWYLALAKFAFRSNYQIR